MKLEVGKWYRRRDGEVREIVVYKPPYANLDGIFGDSVGCWYWEDGCVSLVHDSMMDLIQEVERPAPDTVPQADLIRAVLDGKPVQWQRVDHPEDAWADMPSPAGTLVALVMSRDRRFRLKPESVVRWGVVYRAEDFPGTICIVHVYFEADAREDAKGKQSAKVLRIELDPDTLDVISATTEAP